MVDASLKKKLRQIAKEFGVTMSEQNLDICGYALPALNKVVMSRQLLYDDEYIRTFFHEMGHIIDFQKGLYKKLYRKNCSLANVKRFGLSSEIHADFTGKTLCKKYFPTFQYRLFYNTYTGRRTYANFLVELEEDWDNDAA